MIVTVVFNHLMLVLLGIVYKINNSSLHAHIWWYISALRKMGVHKCMTFDLISAGTRAFPHELQ